MPRQIATDTTAPVEAARELFGFAGERWTIRVLAALRPGRRRFGDLAQAIPGVSHKQLAFTLRHLERDGFALRTAYPTIPPRVEYELTQLGRELTERATAFSYFAIEKLPQIQRSRDRYDRGQAEVSARQ